MLTRCAFFEGHVREGKEEEFEKFVEERMIPLWRRFPGTSDVRILRHVSQDPQAPYVHILLEFDFPSPEALEQATVSAVRSESKVETEKLLSMFDGRLFHIVFERKEFSK